MNRIWQPDNSVAVTGGGLHRVHQNVRMRNAVLLIAERMISTNPSITHLALGNGLGNGTLALPQAADTERSTMRSEFNRVPITSIAFDDLTNDQGDTYSDGVRTNRLLITTEVPLEECSEQITEVALFGGTGASATDGGTIFAWSTFPVIDNRLGGDDPTAPNDLTFSWVLKFPLVTVVD